MSVVFKDCVGSATVYVESRGLIVYDRDNGITERSVVC